MGETLEYDDSAARQEAVIYETRAMVERRRLVRDRLALEAGETALSIGCGPGFEPAELAPLVGEAGRVHAVDRSEAMLALAERRCGDLPQVALTAANAVDLPLADESVDAATAVQVYRYVEDVEAALEELHRVLEPGGRAVVYDSDFDSLVWHSPNRERTARILEAFDDACPHPRLGSRLAPPLREAGFASSASNRTRSSRRASTRRRSPTDSRGRSRTTRRSTRTSPTARRRRGSRTSARRTTAARPSSA